MGRAESLAEEMGRNAGQAASLFTWDRVALPILDLIDRGENFHSIGRIPPEFKRASRKVAGKNAQLLFKLFVEITSKTRKIASEEGGGCVHRPYIYDKRDSASPKVFGVKIRRRGGLSRLATLELALPTDKGILTLSVRDTRLSDTTPDLVIRANKEGITLVEKERQIPKDEKWLDEPFLKYLEGVLTEAQALCPELAS